MQNKTEPPSSGQLLDPALPEELSDWTRLSPVKSQLQFPSADLEADDGRIPCKLVTVHPRAPCRKNTLDRRKVRHTGIDKLKGTAKVWMRKKVTRVQRVWRMERMHRLLRRHWEFNKIDRYVYHAARTRK
ncbi:60S ribosomal protein L19 [Fukomys damarensis]|uniref:60S ribosomal protein L19 n=1 Tax=Fukomys damarensis TaxID=885580 RepID=A0A091CQK1_FUKDA|nr:60S ribosomal protein L19 [Fukomys damarensis]